MNTTVKEKWKVPIFHNFHQSKYNADKINIPAATLTYVPSTLSVLPGIDYRCYANPKSEANDAISENYNALEFFRSYWDNLKWTKIN